MIKLSESNQRPTSVGTPLKVRTGPSGVHFFWRSLGLNVLCDEIRVPRTLWSSAPQQISIAITNRCDLACSYCYAPKNRETADIGRVESWLRELDANGCLGVGFGGGEPTLHPQFLQLCQNVARDTKMAITFTTHSHRVDHGLISALKGNIHFVRVSMDGIGNTYEELRGRSFAELRKRLAMVRLLAPFGINFVVNVRTFPDLDAAIDVAEEVGASEFLLLPEQSVGSTGGIDPSTLGRLHKWMEKYHRDMPLSISEAGAEGVLDSEAVESGLRAYAHIDAVGILKKSSFEHGGIPIEPGGIMAALRQLRIQCKEEF